MEMEAQPPVSCHIGAGNKSSVRTASAFNYYGHLLRRPGKALIHTLNSWSLQHTQDRTA